MTFVGLEPPSTDVEKFVTVPQRVRKRQASPPSVRDDEWRGTIIKKVRLSEDSHASLHDDTPVWVHSSEPTPAWRGSGPTQEKMNLNTSNNTKKNIAGPCSLPFSVHGSSRTVIKMKKCHSAVEDKKDKIRRELKDIGVRILEKDEIEAMTDSVCQYIGAGAYGSCTKTVDPHTQQELVIKSFQDNFEDLLIETKNLHKLQIPGVQRLMGVCVDNCQLLSYFAGNIALHYFRKGVSFVDAATVFFQIAQALRNMVRKGFIHNDLKGDNVCVSHKGSGIVATIIDLGLVVPIGTERTFLGKRDPNILPWIAPELVTQTHTSSEATDAYSLAFMMNGLLKIKGCMNPDVDAGLIRWIDAALRQDPAERPTLTSLVVLLEEILEDTFKRDAHSGDER